MLHLITPETAHAKTGLASRVRRAALISLAKHSEFDTRFLFDLDPDDWLDCEDTTYFVYTDTGGDVQGCVWIRPTLSQSFDAERYRDLCDLKWIEPAEDIWECGYFILDPEDLAAGEDRVNIIRCINRGIVERCKSLGIAGLVQLSHQKLFGMSQRVGLSEPIGLPIRPNKGGWAFIPTLTRVDTEKLSRFVSSLPTQSQVSNSIEPEGKIVVKTSNVQDEVIAANAITSALSFVKTSIEGTDTQMLDERDELIEQLEELIALTGRWALKTRIDRRDNNKWN